MKVIFLEDVPNIGEVGEVKEVADGYGRNFLIPRKLAVLANSAASHLVEAQLKKKARRQAEIEAEMGELAKQLEGKEVILKARAGAKDRLYGSITSADIADELSNSAGIVVDKRKIELAEPIRQLGSYEVTIRLTKDIVPAIKVTVVGGEGEKEEEKEKEKEKGKPEARKRKKAKVDKEEEGEEGEGKKEGEEKEKEKEKPEARKRKKAKVDKEKEGEEGEGEKEEKEKEKEKEKPEARKRKKAKGEKEAEEKEAD